MEPLYQTFSMASEDSRSAFQVLWSVWDATLKVQVCFLDSSLLSSAGNQKYVYCSLNKNFAE